MVRYFFPELVKKVVPILKHKKQKWDKNKQNNVEKCLVKYLRRNSASCGFRYGSLSKSLDNSGSSDLPLTVTSVDIVTRRWRNWICQRKARAPDVRHLAHVDDSWTKLRAKQREREIGSSLVSLFGWRRLVMWAKTNETEGARFKSCRDLP